MNEEDAGPELVPYRSTVPRVLAAFSILLPLALLIPAAASTTWTVDDDWDGADFSTLQEAVDASSAGDLIRVHAGSYLGHVDLNRSVAVVGNGTGDTVLGACRDVTVLDVAADGVSIGSLSVEGSGHGRALRTYGAADTVIGNCDLRGGWWAIELGGGDGFTLFNSAVSANAACIYSWNATDMTISGTSFAGGGLWLNGADGLWLTGSTVEDAYGTGIYAHGSAMLVEDCAVSGAGGDGIRVLGDGAEVLDCEVTGVSWSGIRATGTMALVEGCTVDTAGSHGIAFEGSGGIVSGAHTSNVAENGIDLRGSDIAVEGCTASGGGFGIALNVTGASVTGSSVLSDLLVTGDGVAVSECSFRGARIRLDGASNITVSGCVLTGEGIWATLSSDAAFSDVRIINDPATGVYLERSTRFTFVRLVVEGSANEGVYLFLSDDNVLEDAAVSGNGGTGVLVHGSQRNAVLNSSIERNGGSGVVLSGGSTGNEVRGCGISENAMYGVRIVRGYYASPTGNAVLLNHISSNGAGASQGYDDSPGNRWNGTSAGNRWSDYGGRDDDGDGIGDTPYRIDGGAEDSLPVMDPSIVDPYPVASIVSITPETALLSETVTLVGTATDNRRVERYVWTSNIDGGLYDGPEASFSVSRLSDGQHRVTFVAYDDRGQGSAPAAGTLVVNIRPIAWISAPIADDVLGGWTDIAGTAQDQDGAVVLVEVSIDGGEWAAASGRTDWRMALDTSRLRNGRHGIAVRAWDGYHHSDLATVSVDVRNDEGDDALSIPVPEEPATWAGAGAAVASVVILSSTSVGFYLLVSLLFPIFTRLRGDKVADQATRGAIIEYVMRRPGAHFSQIREDLDMSNGQLGYHLRVLERSGFLRARSDGFHKRFYPHGFRIPEFVLEPAEHRIVGVVGERPGISGKDLAAALRLTPATISHHVARLKAKGVLTASRGKGIRLTDDYLGVLETERIPEFEYLGEAEPGPQRASK